MRTHDEELEFQAGQALGVMRRWYANASPSDRATMEAEMPWLLTPVEPITEALTSQKSYEGPEQPALDTVVEATKNWGAVLHMDNDAANELAEEIRDTESTCVDTTVVHIEDRFYVVAILTRGTDVPGADVDIISNSAERIN